MLTFLPLNVAVVQHLLVAIGNLRHVRNEHIETFLLGQNGSSCTALTCS